MDGLEKELDMFPSKRRGRRSMEKVKARRSVSEEERKKYAAIECLAAVTDEVSKEIFIVHFGFVNIYRVANLTYIRESSIMPSIYFSSLVKSDLNLYLELTSTKR